MDRGTRTKRKILTWVNFDYEYGKINYKDKVVLDIGADFGRTAGYFLDRGAKLVIAVEGSLRYIRMLRKGKIVFKGRVVPICSWITKPEDIVELILKYQPDVAKVDCEGCEVHLFNAPDHVFSLIPEYIIEVHSDLLLETMVDKCKRNNYDIWHIIPWVPHVNIVYARRRA